MTKQQKLIGLIGVVVVTGVGYAAISNTLLSNTDLPQVNMASNVRAVDAQSHIDESLSTTISNSSILTANENLEDAQKDADYADNKFHTAFDNDFAIERETDSADSDFQKTSPDASPSTITRSIAETSNGKSKKISPENKAINRSIFSGSSANNTQASNQGSSSASAKTEQTSIVIATDSATAPEGFPASQTANGDRPINIASTRPTIGDLPQPDLPTVAPQTKVVFTSPLPMIGSTTSYTNSANAIVTGTVVLTKNLRNVTVNGRAVVWRSGTFTANVPLQDGFNTITAVADYGRPKYTANMGITLDTVKPSVNSAVSTGFNSVRVQFNEPMNNETSTNISNFSIVNSTTNTSLPVTAVSFADAAHTAVLLQTGPQSSSNYLVTANNVKDLAGNTILEPDRFHNPSVAVFVGTPPTGDEFADFDEDGLLDHIELHGWPIVIQRADGSTETYNVSSDPLLADTDDDGVGDNEERHGGIDPRNIDTDGDTLTDNQEWNIIYSDPTNQDSDGDGTQDGFEFYAYRTSPTLADTDGDQISDTDEVIARNRDPRIADLPLHSIAVGDIRIQIDERFSYQDEQGETITTNNTSTVTLSQSEGRSRNLSSTVAVNAMLKTGISGGQTQASNTPMVPDIPLGFAEVTFAGGAEFQVSSTSSRESQRVREESFSRAREFSKSSTVTREIIGARIDADVTLKNAGDLAFTISNLEISVLERSRESTRRFFPVATLIANSSLITGEPANYNLGPFTDDRGPIVFTSRDIFPNLADELMQSPSSLVFEIANFDITDEFGRLFTFANQIARDRTASIVVDSGDGNIVRNMVATALQPDGGSPLDPLFPHVGGFNADGSPAGIPVDYALQNTLKLTKNATIADGIVAGSDQIANSTATGDDVQLIPPGTTGVSVGSIVIASGQNGVLDTIADPNDEVEVTTGYATSLTCSPESDKPRALCETDAQCMDAGQLAPLGNCNGPDVLSRFGSLSTGDFDRQWVVLTNGEIPAGSEFSQIVLKPGKDLMFAFVQDLDEDGLFAREEFLSGSTDSRADLLDNSSFGSVDVAGYSTGDSSFTLIDPIASPDGIPDSKDTDRDGLGDFAENRLGWKVSADGGLLEQVMPSPRLADSDGDGLLDPQEQDLRIFCFAPFGDGVPVGLPDDGRLDALCSFESAEEVSQAAAVAIIAGPNGVADSLATGDDEQIFIQGVEGLTYGSSVIGPGGNGILDTALMADDLYESLESSQRVPPATNPVRPDTDLDGVEDFAELTGFMVGLSIRDGSTSAQPTAQTQAIGDDVQQAYIDGPVFPGGIVILPGPNETIDSIPGGDDILDPGVSVVADPLRRDTDSDQVTDGIELALGGNPRNPNDGIEFRDSDQDGLSDAEETILGWMISVNGGPSQMVLSNPSRPDSDFDGLPDFAERILRTDPNKADTDGDGIRDFDEVTDFAQFFGLDQQFPGFSVDGASSQQHGTNPLLSDTDIDGMTDHFELLVGYRVLIGGEPTFRQVFTNPLVMDTDLDGVPDNSERLGNVYGPEIRVTDATDPDTDDDGRSDGVEDIANSNPLEPDVSITVTYKRLILNSIPGDGGNALAEVSWFFMVKRPGDPGNGILLSNAWDCDFSVSPAPTGSCGWILGETTNCPWFAANPTLSYILPLGQARVNPGSPFRSFQGQSTFNLKEGESFSVNGSLLETDIGTSDDCNYAPFYTPSSVSAKCVTNFDETFSYEDFADGGQASFPRIDGSDTLNNCDWEIDIEVEAR